METDRLVQTAAEIEAILGKYRSSAFLIRNAILLEHNLILPQQSVVKLRETAEERAAAQAKGGVAAEGGKRKPFTKPPAVGGKKLKRSDSPSPSNCPLTQGEIDVEEERGEAEGGSDVERLGDDGGDGQGGDGSRALSSGQVGEMQEWTDDAFRQAFEGLDDDLTLVEKTGKADKAGTGASESSPTIPAKVALTTQGELLTPACFTNDRDLGIFYDPLPSWNEIQDLLQYPTPPQGLYNHSCVSFPLFFNL